MQLLTPLIVCLKSSGLYEGSFLTNQKINFIFSTIWAKPSTSDSSVIRIFGFPSNQFCFIYFNSKNTLKNSIFSYKCSIPALTLTRILETLSYFSLVRSHLLMALFTLFSISSIYFLVNASPPSYFKSFKCSFNRAFS